MRLLVRANGELRDVIPHVVLAHAQAHVDAASATLLPAVERHIGRVGDEIRVPDPLVVERATVEVVLVAGVAGVEHRRAVEHEVLVPEQPHHRRRVRRGDVPHLLATRTVEVLVPGIERHREQRACAPLERLLVVVVGPYRGRATAFHDVEADLVHVMFRLRLAAGVDVHHVHVVPQVRIVDPHDRALAALALPRSDFDLPHVGDVVGLVNEDSLFVQPVFISIRDAEIGQTS